MNASRDSDSVFRALADPSRRLLLDRLFEQDGQTLQELTAPLGMTRFGVMKHLHVLEEAGLITTHKRGREKYHYLNPVPIRLILSRWIDKYSAPRVQALASLKSALEGAIAMTSETATKPQQIYQVFIRAGAEQIWRAITSPEFTSRYFYGTHVESTLQQGSPIAYLAADRSTVLVDGEVLESNPPRRLVSTWQMHDSPEVEADPPSRVTWEIEPLEGGVCKLTVVHDQFEGETATFKEVAGGWSWVLSGLKTLLETGEPLQTE